MFSMPSSRRVNNAPPSGVLPILPDEWRFQRLRATADVRTSPIDKLTVDGEQPVRLCNYTDVYKRPFVGEGSNYMSATATPAEIARFRLNDDDVIITKDSETWQDMAAATHVVDPPTDMVCGYHLALIRTDKRTLMGRYLVHALRAPAIHWQFQVGANGVTRFGLSQTPMKSALVPVPPLDEQAAIVKYLGHAHARIDRAIAAKRKLIALLAEQKQVIIHQAVTRGLDPTVPLKDSGIPWLGEIPAHWEVTRAKYLFSEFDRRSGTGGERLLSLRAAAGLVNHDEVSAIPIGPATLEKYKLVSPGNLVMNRMRAASGLFAIASAPGLVSPDYSTMTVDSSVDADFYLRLFKTQAAMAEFKKRSSGLGTGEAGFMRLYSDDFGRVPLPLPPLDEQREIVSTLDVELGRSEAVATKAAREIDLLREFRTRLTSDVVTGHVDVREIAATLPDLADEMLASTSDDAGDSVEDIAEEFVEGESD